MFDLTINLPGSTTQITVRPGALQESGQLLRSVLPDVGNTQVMLVTDHTVGDLYAKTTLDAFRDAGVHPFEFRIPPGESSKSLDTAQQLYKSLAANQMDRDGIIVALGGGVVSDLAGFVAATWMRGIRFAILPTTLEADIDASIGGKTAVNLSTGKNLVGAFHQPVLVAVDPNCLSTLDARDVKAGIAEAIKHALISDEEFFTWQEDHVDEILCLDSAITTEFILRNLRIKAAIVEQDTKEQTGLRMLLNFGHTIGHAIESCSRYSLRHGECVALGTLAACRLSESIGLLSGADVTRVEKLLSRFGLPIQMPTALNTDRILETMQNDKKARAGRVRFVLLDAIGAPLIRDDIDESLVRAAYESLRP
ncbi:MAG: 3-dehydroquinate synthase [Planctomycetes bacterium]|nr:3-dehydroquinate synthase [Planctomycetota bacterium]